MKKILLCLSFAVICAGCGYHDEYFTTWIVRNSTNETILLSPPPFMDYALSNALSPGEEREFYYREDYDNRPSFNALFVNWDGWADENIAFEILLSDGTPLKQWRYVDRNSDGKQFFDVASWKFLYYQDDSSDPRSSWTFEILTGDLD